MTMCNGSRSSRATSSDPPYSQTGRCTRLSVASDVERRRHAEDQRHTIRAWLGHVSLDASRIHAELCGTTPAGGPHLNVEDDGDEAAAANLTLQANAGGVPAGQAGGLYRTRRPASASRCCRSRAAGSAAGLCGGRSPWLASAGEGDLEEFHLTWTKVHATRSQPNVSVGSACGINLPRRAARPARN
jgi:hypothetical protein